MAWLLPSLRLGPPAQRSCGPEGPAVQHKPQTRSGSICEGHLFACSWFRNRCSSFLHLVPTSGSFKEFCPHGDSLYCPQLHVRGRADCEAAASQQGLSDLLQTNRKTTGTHRAAELSAAQMSPWHCSLFTHVPCLSPPPALPSHRQAWLTPPDSLPSPFSKEISGNPTPPEGLVPQGELRLQVFTGDD